MIESDQLMFILTPRKVLFYGLSYVGVDAARQDRMSDLFREQVFHWHYGSTSLVLADIWFSLQQGDYEGASLTPKENCLLGFKRFMMANYFLWVYPRNSGIIATTFNVGERYCRGDDMHRWVKKIACLYPKKIKWNKDLGKPSASRFMASDDGIDCKVWEKRSHIDESQDSKLFSQKFKHAGLKYSVIMDITSARCMAIVGPFKASKHDLAVWRLETKKKMLELQKHGMIIVDGVYVPKADPKINPDCEREIKMLSIPNACNGPALKAFKSRVRARHESFNGRLKNFAILRNEWRGTDHAKHGECFKAIAVIVQYQMDNGAPLFSVQ